MHYVYAIKSQSRNYIYVGMTQNINKRLLQHNNGRSKTTRAYRPFILLYYEIHKTRLSARKREGYLKSGSGKEFLKNLI